MSGVDWPGKLVATVFCQGCPWACPYCHNHAIIDPRIPGVVAWGSVEELLGRRHGLLDGVVFSGGEATRQVALGAAMARVREMGFLVGLHTAGPYPGRLSDLVGRGLIDWVGIDVKALPGPSYEGEAGRPGAGERAWESLGVVLSHLQVDHEVRLTVHPNGPGLAEGLEVARRVRALGARVFALQQARPTGAPTGFVADAPGWDEQVRDLADRIEALDFETFVFRGATA
ncbi:anaerobic ribonucleoside-triphosphate reductase activating protein [Schaalia sp. 19OD2882]|uniref:anaerobic ribonucleoside-triphosphate reductase activating protein n=1 Tax=Schaalia sp. 19OD2882 TaxID=2794089 RepID=UPI001C1F126D|nr:anaerobic ribonucleoside-triphosphate reductase activating protein [Schaalia sp. 19OD2882]QWW20561.1 anaerobic ribonucleoside-triphosphate reductase activating protein [Schaalia sp. 19OD2882]